MRPAIRAGAALAVLALLLGPPRLHAQASAYIPTDDPQLPLLELLIARGDVEDPSPMTRPFRRSDAVRVLTAADTAGAPSADIVRALLEAYRDPAAEAHWSAVARGGGEVYSHARRDQLHPAGPEGASPIAELELRAAFGPIVASARPTVEPRLGDDPDFPTNRDADIAARASEAYVSAQFKWARIFYGQLDRNWGPVGLPGIPLSDYGYERQGLGLELGSRTVRLSAFATDLQPQTDSTGAPVNRYYFAHRLAVRVSRRLELAVWEGSVIAGTGRAFETRYRNPLSSAYLANTLGFGDRGNVMLGLDAQWRAFGATTLQAQLALDDFWYENRQRNRDRWAFTLQASGPLRTRLGWRATYTQVSSLALRAFNPQENFTDGGVGIGRNFSDMDQLSLWLMVPVRSRWLLTPELTLLRQGEGRINDPYPVPDETGALPTPALFIGTVERTYRLGLGLTGGEGPLRITASGGLHRVNNAGHVAGVSDTRFEGRLRATLEFGRRGTFSDPL